MAKRAGQKLRILQVMQLILQHTDEEHGLTLAQMAAMLRDQGLDCERKSLYDDIQTLRDFGLDILLQKQGRQSVYLLASRDFELPELKLLVDAVQSSRFITAKKSEQLIGKIERLASVPQGRQLQRQVYVQGRIKTMNESIYHNVDKLHEAISAGRQIKFRYFQWSVQFGGGSRVVKSYRHGGALYQISPWALLWDDENYYMVGYDGAAGKIKHYRVDKMEAIQLTDLARDGQREFASFDTAVYSKKVFGMYGGQEQTVRLRFADYLAGVVVDRFGTDLPLRPAGPGQFIAVVQVQTSPQFFSWVFGLGDGVQILSPQQIVDDFLHHARQVTDLYGDRNGPDAV
ncbi:Uncharacterised protein [Anaerotruncus sp. 2789STDY5834896]|uniref:Uncharacterized protein n=1 Tax=uncultured Anaerotruncus sp. TaxID=905011 RepID=A0A1C6J8R8_9FIRM|nr:Uncharacterised protein [uncultured Anaerotruncus sp.]